MPPPFCGWAGGGLVLRSLRVVREPNAYQLTTFAPYRVGGGTSLVPRDRAALYTDRFSRHRTSRRQAVEILFTAQKNRITGERRRGAELIIEAVLRQELELIAVFQHGGKPFP